MNKYCELEMYAHTTIPDENKNLIDQWVAFRNLKQQYREAIGVDS